MIPSVNILVTGSKGQLGCELRELLGSHNITGQAEWQLFYTDIEELNIADPEAVDTFIRNNKIDIIINCAAYTAVDQAEGDKEQAFLINGDAPRYLAEALIKNRMNSCRDDGSATIRSHRNPFIIHISTDYVFDGMASVPYNEESPTNPATIYGKSKLAGEIGIIDSGANYVIIRTSWLYSRYGKNFAKAISNSAAEKDEINVVADQAGSPTNAADLAAVIIEIVSQLTDNKPTPAYGVYHYSNEGVCTWYDFACEIVRLSGSKCRVNPITSDKFPTKAVRPAYSALAKEKIKTVYGIDIPEWRDSLEKLSTPNQTDV